MMTTYTGLVIDLTNIYAEEISIRDIAHHLACVNRFGGACRVPINVAQHSVYVSRLVPEQHKLQALLHDASEAYLGDIVHWLKQDETFERYRQIEAVLEQKIWRKFGCDPIMAEEVKKADRTMCRYESSRVGPDIKDWRSIYPPVSREDKKLIGHWRPWNWTTAEEVFLASARMLGVNC